MRKRVFFWDTDRTVRDRCWDRIDRHWDGDVQESWLRGAACGWDWRAGWEQILDAVHGKGATRATDRGLGSRRWFGRGRIVAESEMEHQTGKRQGLTFGGVVQAEVADFDEALG